jgi:hypothetical protein
MKAEVTLCTKYNSLYPTDSANQEIAILRLAALYHAVPWYFSWR